MIASFVARRRAARSDCSFDDLVLVDAIGVGQREQKRNGASPVSVARWAVAWRIPRARVTRDTYRVPTAHTE
jgi:hypothetical protein